MKKAVKIGTALLSFIYFFLKLLPVNRNKAVMISRQSNKINIDFKLLGERLEKKHKVVYLCKTLEGKENASSFAKLGYGFHMLRQMYHLATSRVCILDSYCPTVSLLKHKSKLTVIQMWHSNGTMKKFGYSALNKREGSTAKIAKMMRMHKNYDVVLASGEAYIKHLAKGFRVPEEIIKIFTLPRFDLLNDKTYEKETQDKIYAKYPSLKNKPTILYAPTFRKDEEEFSERVEDLIKHINTQKYNFVIKLHPLSKVKISNSDVIVDREFSTFDMLFVTDKLISDYSCIIYEAGVRKIPLYFYAYDLNYYKFIRGIALDYDELPGYTENNAKRLSEALEKDYDMAYLEEFIQKYIENTVDCTEKLAEFTETYM